MPKEPAPPPPGWLADLVTAFSESRFDPERNRIEATFMIDPTSRARNRVVLHAGGTDMRTRGLAITNWQAELSLEDGLFLATNVFFEQPGGRLSGAASHDFDGDSLEIRLESDWPPEHHLALLPAPLAAIPAEWGFSWEGPAALAVQTGPASRTNPLGRVQAQIKQRDLRFRDIPLYHVDIHAEWDGDTLWIHHAEGEAPPNAPGGICSATAAIHPASKAYAVRFAAQLLPHMLHPVCSGGLNRFISRFEFPEHAPQASGLITGRWGEEHSYNCRGRIRGEQFIMNDVTLIDLSADLEINKRELALKDIHATRQEGVLYGHLTLPMNRDEAAFNLHSAMNPNAVLELISPDLAELLAPIEFRGESSVVASGEMDYLIRTQMLFQVEVKATGVDVFGVLFDTTLFAVEGRGDEYLVRDFQGRLLEGAATGEARFFPVDESAYRYNLEMAYSNLSVAGLMSLFDANQPTNAPPLPAKKGKARGSLLLSGTTATNWLSQMVARGNIHVDEGPILSIPLFGPLSRWLSQIAPTLGYLTQTDFDAGIDLHDGKLHLDNARLQGATISIGLDGHYDLATEELDFRVQIRFLRDGIFARIINLVTYPLTKLLLEFHLGGTLAEPDWRPVNVPKELYFDFD